MVISVIVLVFEMSHPYENRNLRQEAGGVQND